MYCSFNATAISAFALRRLATTVFLTLALCGGGCTKSMLPGDLSMVQPLSDQPHAGNVYLVRGFIGIWSSGIDRMGQEINEAGIRANVYREEQWKELTATLIARYKDQKVTEPLVIIGHSWGADHALDLARELDHANIRIDLVITLDPVTPPAVPANVRWCYNIYQTNGAWDTIPIFRGVPLISEQGDAGVLQNVNMRTDRTDLLEPDTDHYNIEKNTKIHKEVLLQLMKVCPPREEWVKQHPQAATAAQTADEDWPPRDATGGSNVSVITHPNQSGH